MKPRKENAPVLTGTKTCPKCDTIQPVTEFYPHKGMTDGRLSKCRTCTKSDNNAWRDIPANRDRWNGQRNKKGNMKLHGMTEEEWDTLQEIDVCPGCLRNREEIGRRLAIDHNHTTGKVRGVLCCDCNLVIGNARDETETLLRLVEYLKLDH